MNKAGGFVSLHRKITDWEWYKDTNTKALFLHLLLTANFADTRFMGKKIKRGQIVTSLASLAEETGLSVQNVKTSLKHLISTNEVTNVSTSQYRIITVVKYDEYQTPTDKVTNDQQTPNKGLTNDQQHHNNGNNANKGNKSVSKPPAPTPPSLEEVKQFIQEIGSSVNAEKFYYHYEMSDWTLSNGKKMKNWKAAVRKWQANERGEMNGSGKAGNAGVHTGTDGACRPDYSFLRDTIVQV